MNALLHLDVEDLPRCIVWDKPVTDDLLERLCAANDLLTLERTSEGAIRVHAPTGFFTSSGNNEISHQLQMWWKTHRRGRATDSSGGFYLADGSMLNPDGAYISPERMSSRPPEKGFPHVCPDFVIELLSKTDSLRAAKQKMTMWVANGVLLGWLIDPYKRKVHVYGPDGMRTVSGDAVEGSGPVEGFRLDLAEVWRCYE